ncbi:hypothetical protein [Nocardioides eburneus]|uniref:hypothetical protein n=1 Tax=Nocardioides eburneus TaxID=3231482 RepID=UPI003F5D523D
MRPTFEHYTLGELTTGRVERDLRDQRAVSHSQASRVRTVLNLLFGYALRHDALTRQPGRGTFQLRRPKGTPRALTLERIAAICAAVGNWCTGDDRDPDLLAGLPGPAQRPRQSVP